MHRPFLLLLLPAALAAQDGHDHGVGHTGPRVVERYAWTEPEGRIMAFYSAALAFSPVGAVRAAAPWTLGAGVELSYIPPLSRAQRSESGQKVESTNLAPVLPRPRVQLSLPAGLLVEASWVPPVKAFGVTANLVSLSLAGELGALGPVLLSPRVTGSLGTVKGPITCGEDLQNSTGGDRLYFAYVCHGQESEDEFQPRAVSGELVASRTTPGTLAPYAGVGLRHERNRFDVGVRLGNGDPDPAHPILESTATRGYGFAGLGWTGPLRTSFAGELFYAPGSLLTMRVMAGVRLRNGQPGAAR